MEENKTRNINNLQKELHKKTESFYKNVFLRSYECFLDLFLINIGEDNNNKDDGDNDDDDDENMDMVAVIVGALGSVTKKLGQLME